MSAAALFPPADALAPPVVTAATEPLVQLHLGPQGQPIAATAAQRVPVAPAALWAVLDDVARYAERVPMVRRVRLSEGQVEVGLRFRISFLSAGFAFTADVVRDPGRALELRWLRGEPAHIRIRFDLLPGPDDGSSIAYAHVGFEIESLGWLVKFFLRHHPEIRAGVFAGTALVLLDSMRRAALGEKPVGS